MIDPAKLKKTLNGNAITLRIAEEDEDQKNQIFWEFANFGACANILGDENLALGDPSDGLLEDSRFITTRERLEDYFTNRLTGAVLDKIDYGFLSEEQTEEVWKQASEFARMAVQKNMIVDKFLRSVPDEPIHRKKQYQDEYFHPSVSSARRKPRVYVGEEWEVNFI